MTQRARRWAGAVAGGLLLAAAVIFVVRAGGAANDAWAALRRPDPATVAVLLAAVVVNLGLTGAFFHLLYARHARIPWLEMQALMAGASLLNHLPLRPGLAGRIAWHRAAHGIPVRTSLAVTVQAIGLSAIAAAALVLFAFLAGPRPMLVVGGATAAAVALACGHALRRARPWPLAMALRLGEVGCIAVRSVAAFALVGAELNPGAAVGLAAVAVVATLVPFTSNGLGLREWATGLLAPVLAGVPMERAVVADLVARGGELIVIGVAGSAALVWLGRRAGTGSDRGAAPDETVTSPDRSPGPAP